MIRSDHWDPEVTTVGRCARVVLLLSSCIGEHHWACPVCLYETVFWPGGGGGVSETVYGRLPPCRVLYFPLLLVLNNNSLVLVILQYVCLACAVFSTEMVFDLLLVTFFRRFLCRSFTNNFWVCLWHVKFQLQFFNDAFFSLSETCDVGSVVLERCQLFTW